ncbi:MAG: YbaN family protein [Clostridia bacterium]|nr:YbaN family protein [Clostridia bacterium]
MRPFVSILLIIAGSIFVILGIVGIFLPLLPTTPFLLLAAACYFRGSEKLYSKLIHHPRLGTYIRNYREGKGIPLKTKVISIALLWSSIGYSVMFVVQNIAVRILLLVVATGVTVHIATLATLKEEE